MTDTYRFLIFPPISTDLLGSRGTLSGMVVTLDGRAMVTVQGFYGEFARALRFPDYFGWNANALWDCLTDLTWLDFAALTMVIAYSDHLLLDATPDDREGLLTLLEEVGECWSQPDDGDRDWYRAPAYAREVALASWQPRILQVTPAS